MKARGKLTTMLDTEICVRLLKRSNEAMLRRLETVAVREVCISAITHSELLFASQISRQSREDRAALELLLRHVAVVEYGGEAGEHYAEIRDALRWRGEEMGAHDLLVAAHARSLGLRLATERVREFGQAPGVLVEGWGL